jgi:hypothetical protein
MMSRRSSLISMAGVIVATLQLASPVSAQPSPPTSSGPMTVEHLHSGFYGGGDVKVTDFNHHTSELIGGQAGWVIDDAFFIGGAGYGMVNGGRDDELWYGGLVLQWMVPVGGRVRVGAKALIGGGEATTTQSSRIYADVNFDPRTMGTDPRRLQSTINDIARNAASLRPIAYRYNEGFFVFEPEATASVRVAGPVHLTAGISYRLTSSYYLYGYYTDSDLGGLTGTFGFRIF